MQNTLYKMFVCCHLHPQTKKRQREICRIASELNQIFFRGNKKIST